MKTRSAGLLLGLAGALGLCGCAIPTYVPPVHMQQAPFVEQDFQRYLGEGTATIKGSAFLKTRAGDVKVAAGNTVELIPATAYTKERFAAARQGIQLEPRDPRLAKYVRTTVADAQGYFEFDKIPAGDYHVACYIDWEVPTPFGYGMSRGVALVKTGAQALASVTVVDGDVKKVVVTR